MYRILVIDDDETILEFIQIVLEEDKHEVVSTTDSAAGLELLNRKRMDLVITDIFMPEPGGLQVIINIREKFPQTKILAITAGAKSLDYISLAKELGADRALQKPLEAGKFLATVRSLL